MGLTKQGITENQVVELIENTPKIIYETLPVPPELSFDFLEKHNTETRITETVNNISFNFSNGVYDTNYITGLNFFSGSVPTSINYTGSGILNWIGTDCTYDNGLSIFRPSPNTQYDIVFYFNGTHFIGLVIGFIVANRNVVQ